MVVLDATMLMLFLRPDAAIPSDHHGKAVTKPRERVELLIETLTKNGTRVAVPTPALSELLVKSDAATAQQIVETRNKQAIFRIEPFVSPLINGRPSR